MILAFAVSRHAARFGNDLLIPQYQYAIDEWSFHDWKEGE